MGLKETKWYLYEIDGRVGSIKGLITAPTKEPKSLFASFKLGCFSFIFLGLMPLKLCLLVISKETNRFRECLNPWIEKVFCYNKLFFYIPTSTGYAFSPAMNKDLLAIPVRDLLQK